MRHQHQENTEECPTGDEQAEEYRKDRWKKNHEGFSEDEIEIKLNSQPPHPKHLFTNEFTGGVRITHIPTGLEVIEEGCTYAEPLSRALIKLRGLVDWHKKEFEDFTWRDAIKSICRIEL